MNILEAYIPSSPTPIDEETTPTYIFEMESPRPSPLQSVRKSMQIVRLCVSGRQRGHADNPLFFSLLYIGNKLCEHKGFSA